MSTSDYTTDLEALKESLNQLNKEGLDLSSAMQTYQQGVNQHERCVNTLNTLEQEIENNEWTVTPIELDLEDIFHSLESIEHSIDDLPETHLESSIELLIQAERLLQSGYRQLNLAADTMNNNGVQSADSSSTSSIDEVHRV